VLWVNSNIVLRVHPLDWLEQVSLIAVNKSNTLFNHKLGATTGSCDDLLYNWLVQKRGHHHMRRTSIENCIGCTIDCKSWSFTEFDSLSKCWPEEIITETKSYWIIRSNLSSFNTEFIWFTEVNEALLFSSIPNHTKWECWLRNVVVFIELISEKWSNIHFTWWHKHLLILSHTKDTLDWIINTSLSYESKVFKIIYTRRWCTAQANFRSVFISFKSSWSI